MNARCRPLILFLVIAALAAGGSAAAQEPEVKDLTDETLTPELLIEALTPAADKADKGEGTIRPRGFSAKAPARCEAFHEQKSRGFAARPVTSPIAIEVLFEVDSDSLSQSAEQQLRHLGTALTADTLRASCIRIEGHTDDTGPDAHNQELSERRAARVKRFLVESCGVEGTRLLTEGHGENVPIADNESTDGRRRNRRVQIANLGSGS